MPIKIPLRPCCPCGSFPPRPEAVPNVGVEPSGNTGEPKKLLDLADALEGARSAYLDYESPAQEMLAIASELRDMAKRTAPASVAPSVADTRELEWPDSDALWRADFSYTQQCDFRCATRDEAETAIRNSARIGKVQFSNDDGSIWQDADSVTPATREPERMWRVNSEGHCEFPIIESAWGEENARYIAKSHRMRGFMGIKIQFSIDGGSTWRDAEEGKA